MNKTAKMLLFAAFLFSCFVNAEEDVSKSIKALRMEGFNSGELDTFEIQVSVKKMMLIEYDKNKTPEPTVEHKKTGYLIYLRNYMFDVNPFSNPAPNEIDKKSIKIMSAPGEYEPVVFSIYPFTTLKNCRITVSDFVNAAGDKLPSDSFQINEVKCRPTGLTDSITVRGEFLVKTKEIPLIEEGVSKSVWVNLKTPENTKEGVYKGKLTFSPANKPASEIDVEVKIYPFKLMQPPDISWSPIMAGTWKFEQMEKEFVAVKEHGMTGQVTDSLRPEGDNYSDFTKANKYMDLAKKTGMTGEFVLSNVHIQGTSRFDGVGGMGVRGAQVFSSSTYSKLKTILTKTRDNAISNKWLPYMFYLTTELGSTDGAGPGDFKKTMKGAEEYYAAAREVTGVKLLATFNRPEELTMHWNLPTLDIFGYNGMMFPEWAKGAKQKPCWLTFVTLNDRFGHGLFLWKFNLKGVRPWTQNPGVMTKWEPGLLYYFDNEEHPSVRFERIREGVDDYKYMYTLSQYIKQAKAKGKDTSVAEKMLQMIIDKIPNDHHKDTSGFDFLKLDDFRQQMAEQIVKLMK